MTKVKQLEICNYSLVLSGIVVLASSMQLEATGSVGIIPVRIHIIAAFMFCGLVFYHIYLHFNRSNWFGSFSKMKCKATKVLWWLFNLTVVSGLIALTEWLIHSCHTPIGGIHGKIGFVMLFIALGHTLKRRKFFCTKSKGTQP